MTTQTKEEKSAQNKQTWHRWQQKLKKEVLSYYSLSDFPECVTCKETDIRVLCLDHINGEANKERKKFVKNGKGRFLYSKLRQEGFPEGYQTLCANCNLRKAFENGELIGGIK